MLSIASMSVGMASYYAKFSRKDYYARDADNSGVWVGAGAAALGLTGSVKADDLKRLIEGYHPDGTKLVQNAGEPDRQAGLDLTFSADKSVSVLAELGIPHDCEGIKRGHDVAVQAALGYVQDTAIWTRRGKKGTRLEPTALTAAAFTHHTSRNLDPNLHTHVLLLNIGVRSDGSTGTIRTSDLFYHKMVAGAVYRAQLAYELSHGLGYQIETDERGLFSIRGVPKSVCDAFSTRRQEIKVAVDPAFHGDAKTMAAATLTTRKSKVQADLDALRCQWRDQLAELGWQIDHVPRSRTRNRSASRRASDLTRLVAKGLKATPSLAFNQEHHTLVDRKPAFQRRDLVRYVAEQSTNGHYSAQDIRQAVSHTLADQNGPVRLGTVAPFGVWASRETTDNEARVMSDAAALRQNYWDGIGRLGHRRLIRSARSNRLDDNAIAALDSLTTPGPSFRLLQGRAGSGKTTILEHARKAWERAGYTVIGAAPSARAARELEQGAGIPTSTLATWLLQLRSSISGKFKHDLRQIGRAAWGRRTFQYGPLRFGPKTILVVDEAAMTSTNDLKPLLREARLRNAMVVLTGDVRQLPSVRGASPFSFLVESLGAVELTQNHRQKPMWLRNAVFQVAEGRAVKALSLLARHGRLSTAHSIDSAVRSLVEKWAADRETPIREKLLMAGSRAEVAELNSQAQLARQAKNELGERYVRHGLQRLHEGDRIVFRRNDRKLDVRNGDFGTVLRVHRGSGITGPRVVVRRDDGQTATVKLWAYTDIGLGYAVTAHRAQGATVAKAYAILNPNTTSAELGYVQLSRARHDTFAVLLSPDTSKTHESSLVDLARALQRKSRQPMAAEVRRALSQPEEDLER